MDPKAFLCQNEVDVVLFQHWTSFCELVRASHLLVQ